MYCPGCGSQNQNETKFCTRCGTNVGLVSDALSGKLVEGDRLDDWTAKLLKRYYSGRRDTLTGVLLIPGALMIMFILMSVGVSPFASFLWTCWMFFWGATAIAEGAGKWSASSGELKALGYRLSQGSLERPAEDRAGGRDAAARNASVEVPVPDRQALAAPAQYSTDPIDYPGSVTEQTTRQLEGRGYRPPLEGRPERD
jgi:hypothetical protein